MQSYTKPFACKVFAARAAIVSHRRRRESLCGPEMQRTACVHVFPPSQLAPAKKLPTDDEVFRPRRIVEVCIYEEKS